MPTSEYEPWVLFRKPPDGIVVIEPNRIRIRALPLIP